MPSFSTNCKRCPRLVSFLKQVKKTHPEYYAKPVPAFGESSAQLCIVGLAPGKHGANATGRPFTGDFSGLMLFQTLYKYGFSTSSESHANDSLKLINARITNAVKCLPPDNRPLATEINNCNQWLQQELKALPENYIIVALGTVAHKAVIKALGLKQSDYRFAHAAEHVFDHGRLIDSYHCSRYNTQTGRLTQQMFEDVFRHARDLINSPAASCGELNPG